MRKQIQGNTLHASLEKAASELMQHKRNHPLESREKKKINNQWKKKKKEQRDRAR